MAKTFRISAHQAEGQTLHVRARIIAHWSGSERNTSTRASAHDVEIVDYH